MCPPLVTFSSSINISCTCSIHLIITRDVFFFFFVILILLDVCERKRTLEYLASLNLFDPLLILRISLFSVYAKYNF